MLQIDGHDPGFNGQDLTQVVTELRERNEALRYLTRWRTVRESYQVQALRRSMHAITDGLTVSIPFRTGGWSIEPHLETHLCALARALMDIPCLQVKLEGFADTRGSRRFRRRRLRLDPCQECEQPRTLARAGSGPDLRSIRAQGDAVPRLE